MPPKLGDDADRKEAPRVAQSVVLPDEEAYRSYKEALVDQHIAANIGADRFEQMVAEKARELKRTVGSLKPETIKQVSIATIQGNVVEEHPPCDKRRKFNAGRKAA